MSTRANLQRRGTGTVKVEVIHNGSAEIRTNLRQPLFGTTGNDKTHIVEVRELLGDISETALTYKPTEYLFRIFGRHRNQDVHDDNGDFDYDSHFLGNTDDGAGNTEDNDGVVRVPRTEFEFRVPRVYSVQDLIWQTHKFLARVNVILQAAGWTTELTDGNGDVNGLIPGGVGTIEYLAGEVPIIGTTIGAALPGTLIRCIANAAGLIGFEGSAAFWDSFGIECSPYFQDKTGFPQILARTADDFNFAASVDIHDDWLPGQNTVVGRIFSAKSLYSTLEERDSVLVTSDIPIPHERNLVNGEDQTRFVFGHFDIRGKHSMKSGRDVNDFKMASTWFLEGTTAVARQIMDPPGSTGYCSLVLPSTIPSFNIRCMIRRRQWNFDTNQYETVELPMLTRDMDVMVMRLLFTLQQ